MIEDSGKSLVENEIKKVIDNSNELNACSSYLGLAIGYNYFFPLIKQVLEKKKNGLHKGIKFLTEINKDNLKMVRVFLNLGIDIRHITDTPPP